MTYDTPGLPGTPGLPATFGEMLRYLRRRARLTQRELGIAVGFSDAQIARLESGQRLPDPRNVEARFVPALGLEADLTTAGRLIALASAALNAKWDSLPAQPVPPRPVPPRPKQTNLPAPLTRFIGRERELGEVRFLLGTSRLVTLTGSGGVGKTRLAIEVGASIVEDRPSMPGYSQQSPGSLGFAGNASPLQLAPSFPNGVWLAELAALTEPALVPQTAAAVFGLPERPRREQIEALITYLSDKRLLLILDNCEHLIGACAGLAEVLLAACPHLSILATSREPLRVPSETAWRVPSMPAPDPAIMPGLEQLLDYESVQLFVEHAAAAQPGFVLTPSNLAAVAQICARLDGIPLAIEMAAAQVAALPMEAIADSLGDRFALLTRGSRTALPRQQTLRATLDWSYALLSPQERTLFARLSVFAGGWTVEAARAVCAYETSGLGSETILPLLLQLVHKSLVVTEHRDGQARFGLLETVRLYASEKLGVGEMNHLRDRHLAYCLSLVQETTDFDGQQVDAWLRRIDSEGPNLHLALSWACSRDEYAEGALRLAASLRPWWAHRTRFSEGLAWLERALARGAGTPPTARAWALCARGDLLIYQRNYPRALSSLKASLDAFRETDDLIGTAWCLEALARLAVDDGPQALSLSTEALALFRRQGSLSGMAWALWTLGIASFRLGDVTGATRLLGEAVKTAQANGALWFFAFCLDPLSIVNPGQAMALCECELDRQRQTGYEEGVAILLSAYGGLLFGAGEYEKAHRSLEESVRIWERVHGSNHWSAHALLGLGQVLLSLGHIDQALNLFDRYERSAREAGVVYAIYEARFHAGTAHLMRGDLARTTQLACVCLEWFHAASERRPTVCCLTRLADLASRSGQAGRACTLLGAAQALEKEVDTMSGASVACYFRYWHASAQRSIVEPTLTAACASLGESEYEAAFLSGQRMTLEQAVAYALR